MSAWKKKKGKTWKFMDAGSNSWNAREENWQHRMNLQGRMEKKNQTLGTKRCENIATL